MICTTGLNMSLKVIQSLYFIHKTLSITGVHVSVSMSCLVSVLHRLQQMVNQDIIGSKTNITLFYKIANLELKKNRKETNIPKLWLKNEN